VRWQLAPAEQHRRAPAAALLRGGGLPHRPEHDDMVGQHETDGHAGLHHGSDLARGLHAGDVPPAAQAERVADVVDTGSAEPRVRNAGTGIAGDAVDVVNVQARVGDRTQHGLQGEVQAGPAESTPDLGLAGAGQHRLTVERTPAHQKIHRETISTTAAGFSEPSISTVWRTSKFTVSSPILSASAISERTRTRLPAFTGARNRTLLRP